MRTPENRFGGFAREDWAKNFAKVVMTVFGLSHTYNTKVGNDFVRGVSGGERKRVSIAEMALAGSPIAAWDNSTRGLDAATALEFTRSLRMMANLGGNVHAVAIYQASQAIYDEFDKAVVLYEGRQIYYGLASEAKQYFLDMGYECPPRQTTGDFLTSVTNPLERKAREGYEERVPRTPSEFEKYWKESQAYKDLLEEIEQYEKDFPIGGHTLEEFAESRRGMQAKHVRPDSPYTVSVPMQVRYCTQRAYQRILGDKTSTITTIVGQIVMSLIIGSIFYGTGETTASFSAKGGMQHSWPMLERANKHRRSVLRCLAQCTYFYQRDRQSLQSKTNYREASVRDPSSTIIIRSISPRNVQLASNITCRSFAFYHPFAEALAGIVSDIPIKFIIAVCFNIILYFLSGLRREPAQFFIFFLFNFIAILTVSSLFHRC
jgi:ATP-binding cassette, subfamily G (WHITE), member 2, PDR